ncbi:MAG TPA: hypothetical protein VFD43_09615, partial [Planctomycetota bacterium]|nr:hypothetical protein [Planctomycetota bacterium]
VAGLFYRNAAVYLDARYINGYEQRWRVVRANLESGAIVSHLPLSRNGLRVLFESGPGETDSVISVRLHTEEPWQYEPELQVQWWALPIRDEQRPWRAEERPPEPVAARTRLVGDDCADGRRPVLSLTGEPRLGKPIEFVVEGGPPSGSVRLLIGAGSVELRRPRSTLFVDPERMLLLEVPADERGVSRLELTVPQHRRLAGLEVTIQAAVRGPPDSRPAWWLSCGLSLVIGS